jgi:hypothetical protein
MYKYIHTCVCVLGEGTCIVGKSYTEPKKRSKETTICFVGGEKLVGIFTSCVSHRVNINLLGTMSRGQDDIGCNQGATTLQSHCSSDQGYHVGISSLRYSFSTHNSGGRNPSDGTGDCRTKEADREDQKKTEPTTSGWQADVRQREVRHVGIVWNGVLVLVRCWCWFCLAAFFYDPIFSLAKTGHYGLLGP